MKPKLGHYMLARMLVSTHGNDRLFEKIRQYYHIGTLHDLTMQSTQAEFLYPMYVCVGCGNIEEHPATKLCVGACRECASTNYPIWSASQYRADWINKEVRKLTTKHKQLLMECINELKYIRTFVREVNNTWRNDHSCGRGLQPEQFTKPMEQVQEEVRNSTSNEQYGRESSSENSGEYARGRRAGNNDIKIRKAKASLSDIRKKLTDKGVL